MLLLTPELTTDLIGALLAAVLVMNRVIRTRRHSRFLGKGDRYEV
jgi:hypothetical protein